MCGHMIYGKHTVPGNSEVCLLGPNRNAALRGEERPKIPLLPTACQMILDGRTKMPTIF